MNEQSLVAVTGALVGGAIGMRTKTTLGLRTYRFARSDASSSTQTRTAVHRGSELHRRGDCAAGASPTKTARCVGALGGALPWSRYAALLKRLATVIDRQAAAVDRFSSKEKKASAAPGGE